MTMYGLLHIPKAETIAVGSTEDLEAVFTDFNVYFDGIYTFFLKTVEQPKIGYEGDDIVQLIRAEFEIYPLSREQEEAYIRGLNAKVDTPRGKRTYR